MSMVPTERLAEVFVEVADTLVDEFDLIEFLQMVTTNTSRMVDARAAGLLLADHRGRLQLMAASDERAKMLELFQVQAVEGPCQDCYRQGAPVVNVDLSQADERWPQFAPRAVQAGFLSVHAFPMRLRRSVIGALNLFGAEPGDMSDADQRIVQALADVATIGLLQERAIHRGEVVTEQLQSALNSRIVIEQAKGALAQIHGCSPDEAFELLRDYARSNHRRLSEVATAVTSDPSGVSDLTAR
ncbi:MAG TPA: GAF and ANTAR domain-containing protein [Nocardioidaceae bacterium]|nr:GAF and ANTAR domain-containing protein [Nocardioidaceae bacterium]